jgi:hypothetical protein
VHTYAGESASLKLYSTAVFGCSLQDLGDELVSNHQELVLVLSNSVVLCDEFCQDTVSDSFSRLRIHPVVDYTPDSSSSYQSIYRHSKVQDLDP